MSQKPLQGGRARAGRGRAQAAEKLNPVAPGQRPGGVGGPPPVAVPAAAPAAGPSGAAWPRPYKNPVVQGQGTAAPENLAKSFGEMAVGGNGNGNGNGNGGNGRGETVCARGGARGKRPLNMEVALVTRPASAVTKCGVTGQEIKLMANYFELVKKPEWVIYQYRVDFSAEEDREIVRKAWLNQQKEKLGAGFLFEGTMIFSSRLYCKPDTPLVLTSFTQDKQPIRITIKYTAQIEQGNVMYLMVYNTLVRRTLGKLDLQLVGRNLFDPKAKTDLREFQLTVWPGYITSIRQHENALLMCCELSHKVMRTDSAYNLLQESRRARDFQNEFMRNIIGQVVMTPYNNKTYRVDDVKWELNPTCTFPTKNGDISYKDYYMRRYPQQARITDLGQPLLLSKLKAKDIRGGKRDDVLLVPELCTLTGLTDEKRKNFQLMKALAQVTHVAPAARIDKLNIFNNRLQTNEQVRAELNGWQLQLSKDLVRLKGRMLPPQGIQLGRGQVVPAGPTADWTRTTQDKPMFTCAPLRDWVVIVPRQLLNDTRNFIKMMKQVAVRLSFDLPEPAYYEINNDSVPELSRAVDNIVAQSTPDLLFFGINMQNADRYGAIKKKCCVDRAMNSQVVCKRNLTHKNVLTIATKVVVQINTKLGGSPWTVNLPRTGAMIVGFDVCHDESDKSKSVGAFVASSNMAMTSWCSSVSMHTSGEELADQIGLAMVMALRRWIDVNGSRPNRIIVYRDGVGDGQIQQVHAHEVGSVIREVQKFFEGDKVPLAYIIVTKRINTRLFLENKTNPGPGLVVDTVITQPEKYDFYLVSQSTNQGTVMPTAYNIIHDETGWTPDMLQRLSFMCCHLYYNLSQTVRVPAPVQYAHKLAFLVSQSLHRAPHPGLQDRLYFI